VSTRGGLWGLGFALAANMNRLKALKKLVRETTLNLHFIDLIQSNRTGLMPGGEDECIGLPS
jgi:hypothetical protein